MKLKSFKIQNYRSCKSTEVPINDGLTCLIGVNGAGKTNILKSIFLIKPFQEYLNLSDTEIETYKQTIVNIELIDESMKVLYLKGSIFFDTDEHNKDVIKNLYLQINFKNFIENQDWFNIWTGQFYLNKIFQEMNAIIHSKKKEFYDFYLQDEKFIHLDENSLIETIRIFTTVYNFFQKTSYYSASLFAEPSKCPSSIEFENNQPKIQFGLEIAHSKFIIDLYELSKINGTEYKSYLNIINKSGIGLINNIIFTEVPLPSQSYEVKSADNIKINNKSRLMVVPSFQIDGYNLSPNQLSEGTFRTLALIFYILNDDSKLLLIEEPEVCVHHGLLSSIIELIKSQSKHKQIIISTHSDFVLDQLEPENIVLVKRDDKKGTTTKSLTKSMSNNDYKALRNYLNETGNLGEYWKEGGFDNE